MPDEQIAAYQASIERLTAGLVKLRAEKGRLKWLVVATLVVAPLVYLWSQSAALLVAIGGFSMFGVGHYVVYMHIHEDKLTIANARRRIAALRESARDASRPSP